jgi:hypothetical protein
MCSYTSNPCESSVISRHPTLRSWPSCSCDVVVEVILLFALGLLALVMLWKLECRVARVRVSNKIQDCELIITIQIKTQVARSPFLSSLSGSGDRLLRASSSLSFPSSSRFQQRWRQTQTWGPWACPASEA